MHAVDEDLGNLLQRERRHLIPTYQRDYEWTEQGQWELLADDIIDVAERLGRARRGAMSEAEQASAAKAVGPHFLGALVLEALPPRGAHVNAVAVIDGQQRLTTVFLILRALVDILAERGLTARARQVRKMILISQEDVTDPDEQYKLWPRRRDRAEWARVMSDTASSQEHRYEEARTYFRNRFSSWQDGASEDDANSWFETLVDAIATKVRVVVVDLENADDAQLIFEVLNGRQTALSAADLVKNLIFMRSGVSEKRMDALYDDYWAPFDDEWWRKNVGRGHAARGRRDQLLATWLTIETSDEVNLGRLYGEARTYLMSVPTDLEEILRGIRDLGREYRNIYERTDEVAPAIAVVYERLEKLGVTTAVPLLAWLRTLPPERLSLRQHVRAVGAVDSFVMRRLMTSGQTRGYGRAFLEVLQAAKSAPSDATVDDAVVAALLAAPHGLQWPTDSEIELEFLERSFYPRLSQWRIRMLLGPIDARLQLARTKSPNATFAYDELTIEHIMPQEWKTHWPLPDGAPETAMERQLARERRINRLGNLTLITGPLNSSVKNGPWTEKRRGLAKHDLLALNDVFKEDVPWDEAAIDARGSLLAQLACGVWARPSQLPVVD